MDINLDSEQLDGQVLASKMRQGLKKAPDAAACWCKQWAIFVDDPVLISRRRDRNISKLCMHLHGVLASTTY